MSEEACYIAGIINMIGKISVRGTKRFAGVEFDET